MLNSIRNIKFIEMRKLTMFITAVCVLFLSFFVSLVNYFAVTCYVNTATDWKILERSPPPQKKRRKYMYKRVIFRKWKIKWYWFSASSNVPLSWRPENSTTRNKGGIPQVAQTDVMSRWRVTHVLDASVSRYRGVICDLGHSKIFTVDTVNRLCFTVESSKTSCDRVTNPV